MAPALFDFLLLILNSGHRKRVFTFRGTQKHGIADALALHGAGKWCGESNQPVGSICFIDSDERKPAIRTGLGSYRYGGTKANFIGRLVGWINYMSVTNTLIQSTHFPVDQRQLPGTFRFVGFVTLYACVLGFQLSQFGTKQRKATRRHIVMHTGRQRGTSRNHHRVIRRFVFEKCAAHGR